MGNAFSPKAFCIILILFMSSGFSFGGARANSCEGGVDCFACVRTPHRHLPGAQTRPQNPGCGPAEPNSTCGYETGRDSEKFYGIVPAVRSFYPVSAGSYFGAFDEYDPFRVSRGLVASSFLSEPGLKAPIYLRNLSLLC